MMRNLTSLGIRSAVCANFQRTIKKEKKTKKGQSFPSEVLSNLGFSEKANDLGQRLLT
jgi:hypothetical protein